MSLINRNTNKSLSRPNLFDPWSPDFDSFFNDAFKRMGLAPSEMTTQLSTWTPKVDISETESEIRVSAELPGLSEKDIDVTFQDNTLTIKGEREFKKEDENENFHRIETSYGSFQRVIPFAVKIDQDKIDAEFKKGLLKITLGKAAEVVTNTRKIKIN